MNEKTAKTIGITAIAVLAFVAVLLLIAMPPEQRNYEVRGAYVDSYYSWLWTAGGSSSICGGFRDFRLS